jgi:hypothetical protein
MSRGRAPVESSPRDQESTTTTIQEKRQSNPQRGASAGSELTNQRPCSDSSPCGRHNISGSLDCLQDSMRGFLVRSRGLDRLRRRGAVLYRQGHREDPVEDCGEQDRARCWGERRLRAALERAEARGVEARAGRECGEVRAATQRPGAGGPRTKRDSSARRRHHGAGRPRARQARSRHGKE